MKMNHDSLRAYLNYTNFNVTINETPDFNAGGQRVSIFDKRPTLKTPEMQKNVQHFVLNLSENDTTTEPTFS